MENFSRVIFTIKNFFLSIQRFSIIQNISSKFELLFSTVHIIFKYIYVYSNILMKINLTTFDVLFL